MRNIFIGIAALLLLSLTTKAQNDSTVYIYGLPVSKDDTVQQFPQRDINPKNTAVPIAHDKIPSRLRKAFHKNDMFSGWENASIYYDENTQLYILQIPTVTTIRTYGVNANGKPVTFHEQTKMNN